ncbi:MAG: hypothetical protein MPJ24_07715 [Pirellulaceae bacterium]|nr:hypothetical protein [Pirellulaceae bacterium]
MNGSSLPLVPTGAKVASWAARILGTSILLFWGFFIVAYLFGDGEEAPSPLTAHDYLGLVVMGGWMIGLGIAWKWELLGGLITLVAYGIAIVANPAVLMFVFIPITAMLSIASWLMRRGG